MQTSYGDLNTQDLTPAEAAEVIEWINQRRRFRGDPPRRRMAWERGFGTRVTADDVKAAWQSIKLARQGVELGADSVLLDARIADFQQLLEKWLNA